jgi:EAL domain-containing protein (putative c-di-GMP-specific phosphodiesterase class I)
LAGQECRISASIGIAIFPEDGGDETTLTKSADVAMYQAKQEGKNNYQLYSQDIKAHSAYRIALETNLRMAIERGELSLHYQPKVDINSGAITGVEALLRWQSATIGDVPTAEFLSVAEETGLIVPIGLWVIRQACLQNVSWQKQGLPPVCVAVNLSTRQLSDHSLLRNIALVLADTGLAPGLLELEITESMVIHNSDNAIKLLTAIKQMGVRVAIDDFGTGYSLLRELKHFPIDTLKIDRSFIHDLAIGIEEQTVAQSIIAMGKTLSATVVAKGVETVEQQTFLRDQACDQLQGFYFSKPVPADEFAVLLQRTSPS